MENRYVLERVLSGIQRPTNLSLALLEELTEKFSEERKVGVGGFGEVYMGVLENWNIAMKRIAVSIHTLDDTLFDREVKNLMKIISHRNVVRFLGFCSNTHLEPIENVAPVAFAQKRERLLCFEYISNGSLDKHITDELRGLKWCERYEIITGICDGLRYLHDEINIIHMDLKPSNIMLDNDMVPKITDFGLSRSDENTHTSGTPFVTRGYGAPEYEKDGKTSKEADMYSLGVIITELVTGHRALPISNHHVLRRWRHRWNKPPTSSLEYKQVIKCVDLALRCRKQGPKDRPYIQDILNDLNKIESEKEDTGQISRYFYDDMLRINPLELRFAFKLNSQISFSIELTNQTNSYFAFNIQTPSMLSTWPQRGVVRPGCTYPVKITVDQPQEWALHAMQNTEGFIVHSTIVREGITDEDITERMFNYEASEKVDEVNLMVIYEPDKSHVDLSFKRQAEDINPSTQGQCAKKPKFCNFQPPENFSSNYPTNMKYLKNPRDRAMDVTTGAIGSLLHKLSELLDGGFNLDSKVRDDVESLLDELLVMHSALRKVSAAQWDNLDDLVEHWADDVRQLSYDIEDEIDGFRVYDEPAANEGLRTPTHQMLSLFEGTTLNQINDVIRDIKDRVNKVAVRHKKYSVDSALANPTTATTIDPRLSSAYKDWREIVGIDGTRDELIERLNGGDDDVSKKQCKIISIVGVGGLGKTTLAKAVYERLKAQFVYGAFVSVGRNPDNKKVLKDILIELDSDKYDNIGTSILDEDQLIKKLRKILRNKRYFIVIDDIWDLKAWEIIKCALLDDNCGSRVITTTRIFTVAKKTGDVYDLKPLSKELSKELLYTRLFGRKGKCSHDQPPELSKKILQKCGGVPLAIISISSLLADKPMGDWSKVYNSIGFGHEDDNTRKILLFSYYDLPCYLRPCMLHLSIYPEDSLIVKDTLIWKWVAESFVNEEPGVTLFEIGERYFNELINRSMIMPMYQQVDHVIDSCRVHDMVLDMICSVSSEQNFVTILDRNGKCSTSQNNVRRLSVQTRDEELQNPLANSSMAKLRSYYANRCHMSMMPSLSRFRVLRVLDLEHCSFLRDCHLEHLGKLLQLRYLSLEETPIFKLPEEIVDLKFLQTLDLSGTHIEELPQSIGLLRKMKRLCLESTNVWSWLGNMTSLEYLSTNLSESPIFVKELCKLTELRVLIIVSYECDEYWMKTFVGSLCKLRNIQELDLFDCNPIGKVDTHWECYEPPPQLRILNIMGNFSRLPAWINSSLLPNLSSLEIKVDVLEKRDVVNLGKFPELGRLNTYGWISSRMDFPDGAFPKLRLLEGVESPFWFLQGSMQSLDKICFDVDVKGLKDANIDFDFISSLGNLPYLVEIFATIRCAGARATDVEEAEAAVAHAHETHPNGPRLELSRKYAPYKMMYDYDDDEEEESDDEQTDNDEESDYEQTDDDELTDNDEEESGSAKEGSFVPLSPPPFPHTLDLFPCSAAEEMERLPSGGPGPCAAMRAVVAREATEAALRAEGELDPLFLRL